ncbi:tat pathway signal sequence [Trichoderma pleuroticola]
MLGYKEYDYSSVEGEEEEAFLSSGDSERNERRPLPSTRPKLSWLLYATVTITSLLTGIVIGYNYRRGTVEKGLTFADTSHLKLCKNLLSNYPSYKAKILDNEINFETHEQRFNGSLFKRSAYSGPPTPEMDQTWGRFTEAGSKTMPDYPPVLNISTEDARASTSYPLKTAVHLNETQNIGYMASLGFFHQIHCLNMLRKFIYLDYYKETQPDWYTQPYLQGHADHCVDMLRESIMCHGDTTLIVYHWINGYADPVPDFSTTHTCRDPEAILDWMQTNQIILKEAVYKHGEMDLPEIF